jgi:aminoglycoside 6'-N-acetyltransferase I
MGLGDRSIFPWMDNLTLVRPIEPRDATDWERMRQTLWPSAPGEHAQEIASYFTGDRHHLMEVLLAIDDAGCAVGFAELSIRSHAEGCSSGRVAYLEGWFVDAAVRRQRIGTALLQAAEAWGRAHACTELGSDTEINNLASAAVHSSLGFTEIERIVCFRKAL